MQFTTEEKAKLFEGLRQRDSLSLRDALDSLRCQIATHTGVENPPRVLNAIVAYALTRTIVVNEILEVINCLAGRDRYA